MELKRAILVGDSTKMHQITLQPTTLCRFYCADAPMLGFTYMH